MTDFHVFDVRGVLVFRWDGEAPPSLQRHYNAEEDRYEVPSEQVLADLDASWTLVEDRERFEVEFRDDPPEEVLADAVLVDDGPLQTTVLCPDEDAVERAVAAGGRRSE